MTLFRRGGKRLHHFAANLFRNWRCQILLESPKFYRRYYKKTLWSFIRHAVYNLMPVRHHRSTRSSDVTLSRPPSSSSLKINNRSFSHASACLWNQLPKELRLPTDHEDLSLSSDVTHVSSSFPSSPLSPSITPLFHSRLKTHLFHIIPP